MVGVTIQCRFGNQLFQYFFIKNLSKKLKVSFFINDSLEEFVLPKYFKIQDFNTIANFLRKTYFKVLIKLNRDKYVLDIEDQCELNLEGSKLDNKLYNGFFQSEQYLKFTNSIFMNNLEIKNIFKEEFNKKYGSLFKDNKTIAIHIRRGDYQNLSTWWRDNLGDTNLSLPISYYKNCLSKIDNVEEFKILFISDDIEFIKSQFSPNNSNHIFIGDDLIIDFQILINADICILSNSSFSWWGAYLNQKKHKLIYSPEYWLGFKIDSEFPKSIIPSGWIKVKAIV